MDHDTHDHDHGLRHDLPRLIGRRRALALLGLGAAALANPAMAADVLTCVADAIETEGPYPADGTNAKAGQTVNVLTQEGVIRNDLRTSFGGMTPTADGVPLEIELTLVDVNNACAPVAGYALYLWHCDTEGHYSLYDETDRNYLRGVGISDENGVVRFTTIVPGCYDGRWPHMHFEVFANPDDIATGRDSLLISQVAFAEADCATVYTDSRYATSARNLPRQSLARDMVFSDSTEAQMTQRTVTMTGDNSSGYQGTVRIGLSV